MKKAMFVTIAALFAGVAVISLSGASGPAAPERAFGVSVRVLPDEEFDDIIQCGLSVFEVGDDASQAEVPAMRIMAGDWSASKYTEKNEIEIELRCHVNAEMTEVVYEVEGTRDERVVLNHLGSVRFEK